MKTIQLTIDIEQWPLKSPFRITGHTFTELEVVVVTLQCDGATGRGEAAGVYYRDETAASMVRQIEAVRTRLEAGVTRAQLQQLMPTGGARNAVDCALWDLEANLTGSPAWQIAGLNTPIPLLTTFTVGANDPERMAAGARAYKGAKALKLKLTGDAEDADRVAAVRDACPEPWLGVDANQGFTRPILEKLLPALVAAKVQLIEQPFAIGREAELDGFISPIPIAADESLQGLADLPAIARRFNVVNIKLDKCGGLTEGLAIAREARRLGLEVMVGNMLGTSLAMAPAFLVGQLCGVVDLDGPVFFREDRAPAVNYADGMITVPAETWGSSRRR